jgi:hypothetical protein
VTLSELFQRWFKCETHAKVYIDNQILRDTGPRTALEDLLRALVKRCDDTEARLKLIEQTKASLVDLREERETREAKDQALDQHFDRRVDALEHSREPTRKATEPDRACEVRWDEPGKRWVLKCSHPSQRGLDSVWTDLGQALAFAGGSWPSLRVTNDPREVVLKPDNSWLGCALVDGNFTLLFLSSQSARDYAAKKGWRLLREEPAEARDCVVVGDHGIIYGPETERSVHNYLAENTGTGRLSRVHARMMRLVPMEGEK